MATLSRSIPGRARRPLLITTAVSAGLWFYERDAALPYEAIAILAVVLLNATMGYIQESRAEAAVTALRAMSAADATVIRGDERRSIPAAEIVPGDIILIAPDGTRRRVLRYEALGDVTKKEASDTLVAAASSKTVMRSRVTFRTLTTERDRSVLPMYKHSTQKHRRFFLRKYLLPRGRTRTECLAR
jgi:hypothetical protein